MGQLFTGLLPRMRGLMEVLQDGIINFFQKLIYQFIIITSRMKKYQFLLIALLTLKCIQVEILSENLLVNNDFSMPLSSAYTSYPGNPGLPGWTCTQQCEIDPCNLLDSYFITVPLPTLNCSGQLIDVDSSNFLETITQIVELKTGRHALIGSFYYPQNQVEVKTFLLYFNNKKIYRNTPKAKEFNKKVDFSFEVMAQSGQNNISISMQSTLNPPDGVGFKVGQMELRRIENHNYENLLNISITNPITICILSFPGSRVVFSELMHFFISIDRLQFYYYHRRVKSYYDEIFLANINALLNIKGTYLQEKVKEYISVFAEEEQFAFSLDQKRRYTDFDFLHRNDDGDGFIVNNKAIAIYSLPFLLLLQTLFYLFCIFLSRYSVSRFFRKYCFSVLYLWLVCEGNVEQYAFFMFSEFQNFFSLSFKFRLINVALLIFFMIVLFTACAFFFWAKFSYGKRARFLFEETKSNLDGAFCSTFDKGVACFIFGAVHRMLIDHPKTQLIFLFALQLGWLIMHLISLKKKLYQHKVLAVLDIILRLVMMVYQISCYIFHLWESMRYFINQNIHLCLIFIFIGLWALEIIVSVVYQLIELFAFCTLKAKVQPINNIQDERANTLHNNIENTLVQDLREHGSSDANLVAAFNKIQIFNDNKKKNAPTRKLEALRSDKRKQFNSSRIQPYRQYRLGNFMGIIKVK